MKFPEIQKPETLERRYLGKISKKALNFMKNVLKMDHNERLLIYYSIDYNYFDEIKHKF